jgi:hypothetical protein
MPTNAINEIQDSLIINTKSQSMSSFLLLDDKLLDILKQKRNELLIELEGELNIKI